MFQIFKDGELFRTFSKGARDRWYNNLIFFDGNVAWNIEHRIMMKDGTEYIIKEMEECNI